MLKHFVYIRLVKLKGDLNVLAGTENGRNFAKKLVGPNFNYGHHSIRLRLAVIAILSLFSR